MAEVRRENLPLKLEVGGSPTTSVKQEVILLILVIPLAVHHVPDAPFAVKAPNVLRHWGRGW